MHPEVARTASQWYYIQETDPTEHRNTSERAERGHAGRNKMQAKTERGRKERGRGQSSSGSELAVVAGPMFRDTFLSGGSLSMMCMCHRRRGHYREGGGE